MVRKAGKEDALELARLAMQFEEANRVICFRKSI